MRIRVPPLTLNHGSSRTLQRMTQPALVCNMDALTPAERQRSQELRRELRFVEREELPDGYAFRCGTDGSLARLGEWIALERKCCPFFRFQLEVDGDTGPVWLRLTGPAGVKEFLRQA
jgi:hypothetical protein